jgi:hypothetical protein
MDLKTLVGTVTIATTGLTTCNNTGGAVDPPPPPLQCSDGGTHMLAATGSVDNNTLTVRVSWAKIGEYADWKVAPTITNVTGGTLESVTLPSSTAGGSAHEAVVVISLASGTSADSGATPSGTFTLAGTISGETGECPVQQDFTFVVDKTGVVVAELEDTLPLRSREPAAIVLARRSGHDVHLTPAGAKSGARVTWTATAGSVVVHADGGATWTLPAAPGLYQIELLVERGEEGLALDTLAFEVT